MKLYIPEHRKDVKVFTPPVIAIKVPPVKAELYEKQLKALPGLKGIDVDSLERTSGVKQVDAPRVGVAETYEEGKNKTKSKKKRKREQS